MTFTLNYEADLTRSCLGRSPHPIARNAPATAPEASQALIQHKRRHRREHFAQLHAQHEIRF